MDIVKTVTDWPVIVQGALGSALFWAILEIGQRGIRRIAARIGGDKKTANWFALAAHEASGDVERMHASSAYTAQCTMFSKALSSQFYLGQFHRC